MPAPQNTTRLLVLLALAWWLAAPGWAQAGRPWDDLIFISQDYSPYVFRDQGRPRGMSLEILDGVLASMGERPVGDRLRILPWGRVQRETRETPHSMALALVRTPRREPLFRWAGPYYQTFTSLWALKSRHIRLNELTDLQGYRVGTVRGDAVYDHLIRVDGVHLEPISGMACNLRMLVARRVDLLGCGRRGAFQAMSRLELAPELFEEVWLLDEVSVYFAFNQGLPAEELARFQKALEAFMATPSYQEILSRYLD